MNLLQKTMLGAALSLGLAGCVPGLGGGAIGVPSAPVVYADRTAADERAALAVELAYSAARTALEAGVDLGRIKGPGAARIAELDRRAYAGVLAMRAARNTANAANYGAAAEQARIVVQQLLLAVQGAK